MRRVCAWCGAAMEEGQDPSDPVITHGICPTCSEHFFGELDSPSLGRFLDQLAAPVLLVDGAGVVRSANRLAQHLLGKNLPQIQGFRGGDVLECAYAQLPGGCGETEHCLGCAIRATVMETFATGEPRDRVPAVQEIRTAAGVDKVRFRITTEKAGATVLLRLDEMEALPAGG